MNKSFKPKFYHHLFYRHHIARGKNFLSELHKINFRASAVSHLSLWLISFDKEYRHSQLYRWCYILCLLRDHKLGQRVTRKSVLLIIPVVSDNQMKANEDKCHVLQSNNGNVLLSIGTAQMQNNTLQKLLEIKRFKNHVGSICKKPKLNALNTLNRVSGSSVFWCSLGQLLVYTFQINPYFSLSFY